MKKTLGIISLLSISLAMAFGVFSSLNTKASKTNAIQEEVASDIYGVQIRSDHVNSNYLVIRDYQIEMTYPAEGTGYTSIYNAPEKIKVYLDSTSEGVYLSSFIDNSPWTINRWECGGVMFPINNTNYETYNGSSIYMIEILEGCTYPNNKSQTVVNSTTKRFINAHYGDSNAKYESFEWAEDVQYQRSEQQLSLFGAEVRGDEGDNSFYIDLRCELYLPEEVTYYVNLGAHINAYEKVIVYLSENDEGKSLAEITSRREAVINRWQSQSFMFSLSKEEFDLYNGTTIYKIKVLGGCELIYQNKICELDGEYTFLNPSYGDPAAKEQVTNLFPDSTPDPITGPITLFGAQVRSDYLNDYYFIDILSESIDGTNNIIYDDLSAINAYSKIKIYLSEEDEGKTLGEVTSLRKGEQNKWTSSAFLFALTAQEYETYNGTTIYMIEVLEGCEIYINNSKATVGRAYRFVNNDYGKASAKYEAFNFSIVANELVNFGYINISGIHNRMDSEAREDPNCNRWIMFLFNDSIFQTNLLVNSWIDKINFLDNILIYQTKDGEPITLRSIFNKDGSGIQLRQFGETNMIGVSIYNTKDENGYLYDCAHMYSIVINANTQIPSFENGDIGYRLIEEKTMIINDEYGLTGPIPDSKDDHGTFRLYEEWNLNWSVVKCLVTFTVVGIDGLEFEDVSLVYGERIYLTKYEQEGYNLEVTTETGDHIYQCIIGGNHNLNIILTYTPITPSKGGLNVPLILIISISGGVLLMGGGVTAIIVVSKKRKAK